jgi:hypothetical protein
MGIRVSAVAMALAITAIGGLSLAQDTAKVQAKAAFQEGKAAYGAGEYAKAAASFRKAYEALPTWKVLYNIAQCEALAKRHGLAFEAFQQYLSQGGDDITAERRDEVMAEIDRLKRVVGSLEVRAPDGSDISVDGIERGQTPLPGRLKVAAGVQHEVIVEHGGDVLLTRKVLVSSGEVISIEAAAVAAQEPVEPDQPDTSDTSDMSYTEEEPSSALATGGWVAIGLGGALLIGGAITGSMAISLDNDLETDCSDGGCPPSRHDDLDKRDALGTTSSVLLGVGVAAAVAGVLMLTLGDDGEEDDDVELGLAPSAAPEFAGASLSGRF